MSTVTGRFAPTPSGRLHLGNILCAMIAWLSVRSRGGRFLLRIEDVDVPRCPRPAGEQILRDMEALGFDWDEAPLWQSERSHLYHEAMDSLAAAGLVYPCFCTRAKLHSMAAPNLGDTQYVYDRSCASLTAEDIAVLRQQRSPSLRLRVPDEEISFTDRVYGQYTENILRDCGDFVLQRSDGLYGYQLAVVVDDALSGVTEVVRGRDILSATPRQLVLQRDLGYPQPEYAHIPLLLDTDGRRLAKRDHDLDVDVLLSRHTKEEILGVLAASCGLLDRPEPVSLQALIPLFDWKKLGTSDMTLARSLRP
ncbi:MAG: tRNA glutamyl-Q(34) synthetase GluQRS [Clostridia bacterium]|nr:tRNA glutamyl-Q(34) synthetase GluQRS [Clostridia bacterium]